LIHRPSAVVFAGGADEFMAANWHIVATNHIVTKIIVSLLVILPLMVCYLTTFKRNYTLKHEVA